MENKNESAFPEPYINDPNLSLSCSKGLTKRELLAGMAMQGLLAKGYDTQTIKMAVRCADELLKQLEK